MKTKDDQPLLDVDAPKEKEVSRKAPQERKRPAGFIYLKEKQQPTNSNQESERNSRKNIDDPDGGSDPILSAIGQFGRYQAWLCFIGFLITVLDAWVALGLKFIAMKTNFICTDGEVLSEVMECK